MLSKDKADAKLNWTRKLRKQNSFYASSLLILALEKKKKNQKERKDMEKKIRRNKFNLNPSTEELSLFEQKLSSEVVSHDIPSQMPMANLIG